MLWGDLVWAVAKWYLLLAAVGGVILVAKLIYWIIFSTYDVIKYLLEVTRRKVEF